MAGEPDRAALLSRGGDAEALVVPGANQHPPPPPHHAADAQEIALLGVGGLLPSNPEGLAGEACTTEGGVVRCKAGWVGGWEAASFVVPWWHSTPARGCGACGCKGLVCGRRAGIPCASLCPRRRANCGEEAIACRYIG